MQRLFRRDLCPNKKLLKWNRLLINLKMMRDLSRSLVKSLTGNKCAEIKWLEMLNQGEMNGSTKLLQIRNLQIVSFIFNLVAEYR